MEAMIYDLYSDHFVEYFNPNFNYFTNATEVAVDPTYGSEFYSEYM